MRWVLAQPDTKLDVAHAFAEVDQVKWSLGHEKYVIDPWQGMLVKTELNSMLENICSALNNELKYAFDVHFGTDTENWKEIDLLPTVRQVVAQAASRFTVGLPLCRDRDYLDTCIDINDRLIMNAGVTGASPPMLQPLVGTLFNLPMKRRVEKMKKWFIPLWKGRLETLKYERDDPNHKEPQDHVQMMIRYAHRERQHELHDMEVMVRRLIVANFGSMHQTSIQVTNMLLNIVGSDAEFNTISILRDEMSRILDEDDTWTKAKVGQMIKADSVARETLRLNSFGGRAIFRKVMVDNFQTEDGYHIPKGTIISFLGQPTQTDGTTFEDPVKYDPFRFSRIREAAARTETKGPPVSFVTTGANYLPFGHGKHACPGRFLIDFEFKMIMAHVLGHYDLEFPKEYGGKRPENTWIAEALFPPDGVKVMVKRRMGKIER
ncbi:hypothetical protein FALCPG4_016050 [Fusarium falciforme]